LLEPDLLFTLPNVKLRFVFSSIFILIAKIQQALVGHLKIEISQRAACRPKVS